MLHLNLVSTSIRETIDAIYRNGNDAVELIKQNIVIQREINQIQKCEPTMQVLLCCDRRQFSQGNNS